MAWVKDPDNQKPSVSLTLVCISAVFCLVAAGLEMFKVVETTSITFEMFGATCGLYWGRKFTSAKGSSLDPKE